MDLPRVKIGGEFITLPAIMNFTTLERAWPALQAMDGAEDQVQRVARSLAFLSQVLLETRPDLTLPELKKRVRVQRFDPDTGDELPDSDERPGVLAAVRQLCIASGLISKNPPREVQGPPPTEQAPMGPMGDPSDEAISPTS